MPHGAALANNCYFVYDRADNVIYRDQQPPVDMSDRGDASRDAMRQRGEYLMYVDTDACAPIAFITGPGTPGTLSVDQIVDGFPAMATAKGVPYGSASPGQGIATIDPRRWRDSRRRRRDAGTAGRRRGSSTGASFRCARPRSTAAARHRRSLHRRTP